MGQRVRLRKIRNAYRILGGGSEIGKPWCRSENSVKRELRGTVCDGVHCRRVT
jgi:hypothetical protein